MDYFGNRHDEKYVFKRVSWLNYSEHGNYDYITDGSIELSTEADLVATGSFSFEGYEIPDTNDLIRIYYRFTDEFGNTESHALATLFTSYSELEYIDTLRGIKAKGTLEGKSVLSVLDESMYGAPYTVKRNENAIYKAVQILKSKNLLVNYTPGSYVLSTDHTFDAGTTWLEIVRWLCDAAGYAAPYPDELGIIQLQPFDDLQRAPARQIFRNDANSIMLPEIEVENPWQETPNVYKLLYNVDTCCMIATARNLSGSRASLDARGGREQTEFDETGELPETGNRLTNLMDKAENELKKVSADVEYVTMKHAWLPLYLYDNITIKYADFEWTGNVGNMTLNLEPGTMTQTKIKRELYDTLEIERTGEYLRGDENED